MTGYRTTGQVQPDWYADRQIPQGGGSTGGWPLVSESTDGQLHHVFDSGWGYFDGTKNKWLSMDSWEKEGGSYALNTASWLWKDYFSTGAWQFDGANFGWTFPFDVDLCAMSMWSSSADTGTCTVYGGASAISGATISIAAATFASDTSYNVATITAGTLIGLRMTSGQMDAGHVNCIFRRVFHE